MAHFSSTEMKHFEHILRAFITKSYNNLLPNFVFLELSCMVASFIKKKFFRNGMPSYFCSEVNSVGHFKIEELI